MSADTRAEYVGKHRDDSADSAWRAGIRDAMASVSRYRPRHAAPAQDGARDE